MQNYLYLLIAGMLLAANFILQKLYQERAGTGLKAGLIFNTLIGLFTAVIFLFILGFKVNFTPYAFILATLMSLFCLLYTLLGFKIIKHGNVSLYTMFLMSGGMMVPYAWGVIFLDEKLNVFRIIGIAVMLLGVLLPHIGSVRADLKQFLLCIAIFFLNGGCSVVSKLGQTESVFGTVNADEFVFLTGITRFVLCGVALLFLLGRKAPSNAEHSSSARFILLLTVFSATISGISYLLQLIGAANLPATVVYPMISGGSIVFTTLADVTFFKEKISLKQKLGVLLCFAGTFLFL